MPSQGISWSVLPWKDIIPRVTLYAHTLLRRRPFAGAQVSADDLVLSAIEKTISGARQWNIENVGIVEHLMGVVSSDLYNSVRKHILHKDIYDEANNIISDGESPEDIALYNQEVRKLLDFMMQRDKRLFEAAYLYIIVGVKSPVELADKMNVSERTARNIHSKLKSSILDYYRLDASTGDKQKEQKNAKGSA